MIKIMLCEDDLDIAEAISKDLTAQSPEYQIQIVTTGEKALALFDRSIDVLLLDIMLPDSSGIDLCAKFREIHLCPILFISFLDDSDTIIRALGQGGDDYICKPFDNRVLHARIQANLRRSKYEKENAIGRLRRGQYMLDPEKQVLYVNGDPVSLLPIEFHILSVLMENPGKWYMARDLYRIVWGQDSAGDVRTVVVHVHNLRKKIGDTMDNPQIIRNERGKGYSFTRF